CGCGGETQGIRSRNASPAGTPPTRIVAVTPFVFGSIREMVRVPPFATQTAPPPPTIATGDCPTRMFVTTGVPVSGVIRIRETSSCSAPTTQIEFAYAVKAIGRPATVIERSTVRSGGFSSVTVFTSAFAIQSAPSAQTIAAGSFATVYSSVVCRLVLGSIAVSVARPKSGPQVTQTRPPP